jgi:hypothetical protein
MLATRIVDTKLTGLRYEKQPIDATTITLGGIAMCKKHPENSGCSAETKNSLLSVELFLNFSDLMLKYLPVSARLPIGAHCALIVINSRICRHNAGGA